MVLGLRTATALAASLLSVRCAQGSWDALWLEEEQAANELSLVQRDIELRGHLGRSTPAGSAGASAAGARAATPSPTALLQTGGNSRVVPELYVDLDREPLVRWWNVTQYYKDIGALPGALLFKEPFSQPLKTLWKTMKLDEDYLTEMRGIVTAVNDPRVTLDNVLMQNMRYELSGFSESPAGLASSTATPSGGIFGVPMEGCSGLLAAMPNGTVVHGRNMDYSNMEVTLRNGSVLHWPEVTADVVFLRDGKPLFVSTSWPGIVGIHTAMRFDGWSFEQNMRVHGMDASILSGIAEGSEVYPLRARRIMETVPDFEAAVQALNESKLMAPSYFVLAGPLPYQGAVITVDRDGNHLPTTPAIKRLSPESPTMKDGKSYSAWHLIQTNDDQDSSPLDLRRPAEEARLSGSSQETVGVPWVFNEMVTPPIYGPLTVFTTVYVPGTGYHRSVAHLGNTR